MKKQKTRKVYELAVLTKKYWLSFFQNHFKGETKGLANQGFILTQEAEALIIKELSIIFLWILSNTAQDDDELTNEFADLVHQTHNVYMNNHNSEPLLDEIHMDVLEFSTHYKFPQIDPMRLLSRYRQYNDILRSDDPDKMFELYGLMIYNMMPMEDLNLFTQLYYYDCLNRFIVALRKDARTFASNLIEE